MKILLRLIQYRLDCRVPDQLHRDDHPQSSILQKDNARFTCNLTDCNLLTTDLVADYTGKQAMRYRLRV